MLTLKRYFMAIVMLMSCHAALATAIDNSVSSKPIVDCVIKQAAKAKHLYQINPSLSLLTHPCSGGIYLLDKSLNPNQRMELTIPVVQGWWLHQMGKVVQQDNDSFFVSANFITGVGPVGNRPFKATIKMEKVDDKWLAGEPIHFKGAKLISKRANLKLVEISSQQELEQLNMQPKNVLLDINVDFSKQRLLLKWLRLKSSKIRIDEVFLSKNADSYQLQFKTKSPQIVTKDFKNSLIWLVLPKDGLAVEMYNRFIHGETVSVQQFQYGVIDRVRFN